MITITFHHHHITGLTTLRSRAERIVVRPDLLITPPSRAEKLPAAVGRGVHSLISPSCR